MAPKLIAFIVTLLANLAIGVVVFFGVLVTMNGYSESDAIYGLVAYGVLSFLVSIFMAASAFFLSGLLIKRKINTLAAVAIAIVALSVLGAGLKLVCGLVGVGVAEFVRTSF
ncbi:MAG: hypothetical protein AB7J13_15640 [Pyrinomonadaceae bacterium]